MRKTAAQWLAQLRSPNEELAHRARLKLGSLTKADQWMLDDLLAALKAPDGEHRFWATEAISCLVSHGVPDSRVADALLDVLEPEEAFGTRQAALTALARAGATSEHVIARVLRVLRDDEVPFVRAYAATALGDLGRASSDAVDGLLQALHDGEPRVRSAAAIALKFMTIDKPEHERTLAIESAEHPDEAVRSQLAIAATLAARR